MILYGPDHVVIIYGKLFRFLKKGPNRCFWKGGSGFPEIHIASATLQNPHPKKKRTGEVDFYVFASSDGWIVWWSKSWFRTICELNQGQLSSSDTSRKNNPWQVPLDRTAGDWAGRWYYNVPCPCSVSAFLDAISKSRFLLFLFFSTTIT